MLRLSSFVVHAYLEDAGQQKVLLFQSRLSALLLVSPTVWGYLRGGHFDAVATDIKATLIENDILVEASRNEIQEVFQENDEGAANPEVLHRVIMPSGACQLACNEDSCGAYCGQLHEAQFLSDDHAAAIIQNIESRLRTGRHKELFVSWFGGEPLLAIKVIRAMSLKLLELCHRFEVQYRARVVTNGLLLTQEMAVELRHKLGVTHVEVTLDGTAEYHDKRRCLKRSHRPTFQTILGNLTTIVADPSLSDLLLSVRCNVDRRNRDGVKPLVDQLESLSILKRARFYVAPVRPWGNDVSNLSMSEEEYASFEADILALLMRKKAQVTLLPSRKKVTCASVRRESEVIDPFGMVHRCTETPLVPAYERHSDSSLVTIKRDRRSRRTPRGINRFAEGDVMGENRRSGEASEFSAFSKYSLTQDLPCRRCEMLPVCGGSCPLQWYLGNRPCPSTRTNIKARMVLAYAMSKEQRSGTHSLGI